MTLAKREPLSIISKERVEQIETLLHENFAPGVAPEFDRITTPAGGGTSFTLKTSEGDEQVSTLEGVIVYWHKARAFWPGPFAGGAPPQCSSLDGLVGTGDPGGPCVSCKFNQWGSGKEGRGKACKEMLRIYFLRQGELFPRLLVLPPSSIDSYRQYAKLLLQEGVSIHDVVTRFSLVAAKNQSGISYSQVTMQAVAPLVVLERVMVRGQKKSLEPYFKAKLIEPDEYAQEYIQGAGDVGDGGFGSAGRVGMEEHKGELAQDPAMRYTPSGKAVTDFWLRADPVGGEDPRLLPCVAWESLAEQINEYAQGTRLAVIGYWRTRRVYDQAGAESLEQEFNVQQVSWGGEPPSSSPPQVEAAVPSAQPPQGLVATIEGSITLGPTPIPGDVVGEKEVGIVLLEPTGKQGEHVRFFGALGTEVLEKVKQGDVVRARGTWRETATPRGAAFRVMWATQYQVVQTLAEAAISKVRGHDPAAKIPDAPAPAPAPAATMPPLTKPQKRYPKLPPGELPF